ncbi:MAG: hypothetical protein R3B48_28560 [Kofleriaceae bacterium]
MRSLLLVLALGALACTQPRSRRCRDVCARQLECRDVGAKDLEISFDEKECVAQCTALETDPETRPLVEARAACLAQPDACTRCP